MPIARPRSSAENQPITRRPVAAYTEALAAPDRARRRPSGTRPLTWVPRARSAAVAVRPAVMTMRSPIRSASAPPGDEGEDEARGGAGDDKADLTQAQRAVMTQLVGHVGQSVDEDIGGGLHPVIFSII